MARTKISEFSSTPANNTDIDSINIAEGCAPSGINDAIRELMAQLKDWQSGTSNDPYVVGSSGSLTLSYGTANGVAYLNGSKVLTTGSALTFDGTNLGLGVTPSASWWASMKSIGVGRLGNGVFGATNDDEINIGANVINTGSGTYIYGATDTASLYRQIAAQHVWYYAGSGTAGAALTLTEAMRINSSGNVGIGTSSPTFTSGSGLEIERTDANATVRLQRAGTSPSSMEIRSGANTGEIFVTSNSPLLFATNGTERMRLDSSGNLGLGVTPSTGGYGIAFQFAHAGNGGGITAQSISTNNYPVNLTSNAISSGSSTWKYFNTDGGSATRYQQVAGAHSWFTAPSGTAGNAISFTQAMTLDASGNLGVGQTSPGAKLEAAGNLRITNATVANSAIFQVTSDATGSNGVNLESTYYGSGGFGPIKFTTSGTERARIDSSGNFTLGSASSSIYLQPSGASYINNNAQAAGWAFASFQRSGTTIGSITQNGTTAVLYNTTSDHRLKENVTPLTGALVKVQALKPSEFDWIDGRHDDGFIAHELQAVLPNVVTGDKDAVDEDGNPKYQQVDYARIVPTLVAAIQEQQAIINQLKADVAALKGA